MLSRHSLKYIVCVAAITFIGTWVVRADQASAPKKLQALEVLSGYSNATVVAGYYRAVPLMVDFDYNLKAIYNFSFPVLLQAQVEPYISTLLKPDSNIETGLSGALKAGLFPESWRVQPYIKAGVGISYMTQHLVEQSTRFNFIEYVGGGIAYKLTDSIFVSGEFRFRHLSNAGIDVPNHGVNSRFVLVGLGYQF